jgi:hypothetical protein
MRRRNGWCIISLLAAVAALGGVGSCVVGCAPQSTELERFSDRVFLEVIGPAATKAIAETSTRTATLQGGAQVIEPGYAVDVEGFWGTGVKASTVVRVVGVSGQLTGHAQGDQGQAATVPPPANRDESTEMSDPDTSAAPGG